MPPTNRQYNCIVIGGGPAGCTAAALVAQAGYTTLLVERDALPREHVGESLMPETYWTFEKLGVLDQLKASRFAKKVGVQFVNNTGRESQPFFFRNHDPHESSETWHVDRAEFDQMLFDNARAKGAECLDKTRVLDVLKTQDLVTGVRLQSDGQTVDISSRVVFDCSGQQSLLANKFGVKQVNPNLRKASIWRHYRGADRDESGGGVKTIISHTRDKQAWFWYIPQADDLVSVGVVADNDYLLKGRGKPEQIFAEELQKCDGVRQRVEGAEPLDDLRVAKEFSYSTTQPAGDGWVLAGDAWGFIDPVYSSGVYFAMKSAEMASECVIDALRLDDPSAERLGAWNDEFSAGTKWVRKLVHAFYSGEFRVGKFAMEHPEHTAALTNLLIGRMFHEDVPKLFDDLDPWLERMIAEASDSEPDDEMVDGAPVLA
ncbi:putative FAD-dependent oxidoreductase LodB [Posidoniimonas polymericola]|uniref:Putative FAD-dependent oxidoreductase LodB n=1 Tax=Posidoniimonas polymericola TaxID=2528002 RepID=A0A5C5YRZ2_9BACT|nr:NAD(P)/FAD-dependent oxidoreductase [Posidoniimonas polymericola]TWT77679.1 putative FAD-dependent oxidoreductase LodB [Posidoniimonas polymericola]